MTTPRPLRFMVLFTALLLALAAVSVCAVRCYIRATPQRGAELLAQMEAMDKVVTKMDKVSPQAQWIAAEEVER